MRSIIICGKQGVGKTKLLNECFEKICDPKVLLAHASGIILYNNSDIVLALDNASIYDLAKLWRAVHKKKIKSFVVATQEEEEILEAWFGKEENVVIQKLPQEKEVRWGGVEL